MQFPSYYLKVNLDSAERMPFFQRKLYIMKKYLSFFLDKSKRKKGLLILTRDKNVSAQCTILFLFFLIYYTTIVVVYLLLLLLYIERVSAAVSPKVFSLQLRKFRVLFLSKNSINILFMDC